MFSGVNSSFGQLKLIESLGSNKWETIKSTIIELEFQSEKEKRTAGSSMTSQSLPYGSPLHLTIILSENTILRHILDEFCGNSAQRKEYSHWLADVNHPDGETCLHVGVRLDKFDCVQMLLQTNMIDETIRNSQGQMAEDLSNSLRMTNLLRGLVIYWIDFESHSDHT